MSKIKEFYEKHKIFIKYLLFGAFTTVASFSAFYLTLWVGKVWFGALEGGKDSARYLATNIIANILKWCSGVLVAFYTNKKWVFTEADKDVSTGKQLLIFAEGRVITLLLSLVIQYLLELLLASIITSDLTLLGITLSAEILGTTAALAIYSVVEIIANYYFSKLFVFKSKTK